MMSSCRNVVIAGALLMAAAILCGCHSDAYYQNRAAERARKYLLEEAKGLSAEEKYYITFNDPFFLTSPILGEVGFAKIKSLSAPTLTDQLNQICITWHLPGHDEFFMVYGASGGRMEYWYPDRVIRKRFVLPKTSGLETATTEARKYAIDNLFLQMSVAEQNFIRFSFPAVCETNFALNLNPRGNADEEELAKASEEAATGIQYSIIWDYPESEEVAVFCGMGSLEMQAWRLNFAGKISRDELARHIVARIKTPEEFYMPFPARYLKPVPVSAPPAEPAGGTSESASETANENSSQPDKAADSSNSEEKN